MIKTHQIINSHRLSNSYIIELNSGKVILIDVGNFDIDCLIFWLQKKNKTLNSVIITHEHSDHCCGLNDLFQINPFQLYCSSKCAENMKNPKQNFSLYLDNISTFEVHIPFIAIENLSVIEIDETIFSILQTPGHSPGSICILVDNSFFAGDTILNGVKTLLTLPHSNKEDYHKSIKKIKSVLKSEMTIYPGHDQPFVYKENMDILN